MKKYCVIGHPVEHSMSPAIHNAGLKELEIPAEFLAVDVSPAKLEQWIKTEFRENFAGAAVTIPHKEKIREFLDIELPAAQNIGAVNTIFWKEDKLVGTNTDCIGVLRALEQEISLRNKSVLVLGAGGASRAVIYALLVADCKVNIWNRTKDKAENLEKFFQTKIDKQPQLKIIPKLADIVSENFDIIINTTSVGLNTNESVLPSSFWQKKHLAFDLVYQPLETKFLFDAEMAGAKTITGDKMLVFQALEQFKIWHQKELSADIMENAFFREN